MASDSGTKRRKEGEDEVKLKRNLTQRERQKTLENDRHVTPEFLCCEITTEKKKWHSLTAMQIFWVSWFSVNLHHPKRLKSSQERVRSHCPGPPLPTLVHPSLRSSPPSAPPPLFHAQSIWNVHVESIKASQMAELAWNAMKHAGSGPGPCWANMEWSYNSLHNTQPPVSSISSMHRHAAPQCHEGHKSLYTY